DNEVGFGQTILDSSVTASAASSNVKEDLVFANTVARVTPIQQLRGPVGDFVGREQEVDEVLQAFNSGRNVIITGIGGTGKTELAFLVAARLSDKYPDGQIVVEMGGTNDRPRDPVDAISFCIRALTGVEQRLPDGLTELVASYRTVLEGKRVLILLDNAFDTNQIREFVPPPGCGLLITSRHAITLPGVTLVMLEALKPAEASKLLRDIAPLVPVHIADEICELCGYLPLAIRAAGSLLVETQDLAPSDFVAQLRDERLRSKQLGIGGIDTRVEASFNLSYQLLEPQAALIFRQLSIFPASFDTDAEETICEDKRYRQLRRLVRRNLVLYSRDTRRYYLHNVARTFSESRLSETERQVIGARHASYYVNILRQAEDHYLKGDTSVMEALRIFDSEWDNIQTGWSWANREFKNNSLAVQLVNDYPLAAENLLDLRQDPRDRILWLEAALQAAQQLNDVKAESYHLGNLGASHVYLGDLDRATMYLEQQLALARKLNDFPGQEYALRNIGFVYSSRGETDRAIEFYQQSLVLARELGDVRKEAITLGHLGVNYFSREEYLRALDYFQQSMVLARQIGDRRGEGQVLGRLGVTYAALGETKRAIEYYQQCLAVTRELGDRQVEGTVLFSLSQAFEQLGNYTQAIDLAQQALEILEQIESPQASKVREQIKRLQH
ncbi:MAG TPA: tetratricopeptide repeat protein, partial [Pyrinomonadaceae bacterium]|nr:tetratricopeptide repeat protein [Pyrinomonadaceae bacterium]